MDAKLLLKKTAAAGNPYGYDLIEILEFNYDGKGSAIARYEGARELEFIHSADLDYVLFGDPGTGDRYYEPADRISLGYRDGLNGNYSPPHNGLVRGLFGLSSREINEQRTYKHGYEAGKKERNRRR